MRCSSIAGGDAYHIEQFGIAIPFARIIPPVSAVLQPIHIHSIQQQQCAPSTFLAVWKVPARSRVYTRFGWWDRWFIWERKISFKLACRGGGWHIRHCEVRLKGLAATANDPPQEAIGASYETQWERNRNLLGFHPFYFFVDDSDI